MARSTEFRSAAPRHTAHLQAQQELVKLLAQLQRGRAREAPGVRGEAVGGPLAGCGAAHATAPLVPPAPHTAPAPVRPAKASAMAPASVQVQRNAAKPGAKSGTRFGTEIVLLSCLVALALALSTIGYHSLSADAARVRGSMQSHDTRLGALELQQQELRAEVQQRLKRLEAHVAEIQHPPPLFAQAQDLFGAGRHADAEAAYHRFLLQSPDSRVADVALNNAAVAAAMQGNCTMARSYARRLRETYPASPMGPRIANIESNCRRLAGTRR